jgi:Prp8 binding protein
MSVRKSPPPPISQQGALTKRARVDDDDQEDGNDGGMTMTVASSGVAGGKGALVRSVKRTSGLAAPIVSLGGAHRVSPDDLAGVVVMCLLSSD